MIACRILLAGFLAGLPGWPDSRAAELTDEFDQNAVDTCIWNTRQADFPRLIRLGQGEFGDASTRYLVSVIDERRELGEDRSAPCPNAALGLMGGTLLEASETDAPLGPSLIDPAPVHAGTLGLSQAPAGNARAASCPMPEMRRGKAIVQRNELRLAPKALWHPLQDPHWYNLVFRAKGDIPDCGSTRWVTAQWKYDDPDWPAAEGDTLSPFLAQRFDNGVLHVTIQSGHCRCMIAKAAGDPDAGGRELFSLQAPDAADLQSVEPLKCVWTDGRTERSCQPGVRLYALSRAIPTLPDPQRDWVDMSYRIKAGTRADGRVDVYANGKFIVRAEGLIGYSWGKPSATKFKFGHYRDKIPGTVRFFFDRFCLSPNAKTCDARLDVLEP